MRRTSAVLASIHAVEPVSIFTRGLLLPVCQLGSAARVSPGGQADFASVKKRPVCNVRISRRYLRGGGGAADDEPGRHDRFRGRAVLPLEAGQGPDDGQVGEARDVLADGGQVD